MRGIINGTGSSHQRYSSDAPPYSRNSVGKIFLSNDDDPETLQKKLRLYSASLLGTSAFFWLWALYNTYHLRNGPGGFDLGVFSFFGSGVSSALLLRSALGGKCCCGEEKVDKSEDVDNYGIRRPNQTTDRALTHAPPGKCLRAFVALTHLTVAANYMLGILFAFTAGPRIYIYFASYCVIFSLLWLVAAYAGLVLMRLYREAVVRAFGKDVKGPPSSLFRSAFGALTNLSEIQSSYDDDDEEDDNMVNAELRLLYEGSDPYSTN